ncbi:PH domain-containing protein [Williamsia sp.]|uniref:PH domain-containing protein n=1 Tax=Williamsia sp. TaxID=1872085 RepID=UPI001A251DFE|nr:PH domain-containing protein [Williamsia sp.]MBJ7290564.1 PH domain-containing protein [Williamsia sp.]
MPESDQPTPAPVELPIQFRIQPMAYFGVFMMMVTAVILAGASLTYLGWTLVLPVLGGYWMYRIRTVVTVDGLRAVGTLRTREIPWDELSGLSFPRWGAVRAVTTDSTRVRLPAIAFRDLPLLSAASAGRIPDPYAARSTD